MINKTVVLVWALFAAVAVPTLGLAQSTRPSGNVTDSSVRRIQVVKNDVSVRSGPDVSKKELAITHKGAEAVVLSTSGAWVNVRFSNAVEGWIHNSMLVFLKKAEGPKTEEPKKAAAPALPSTSDEVALPDTPVRLNTDVEKPKRLSISIGGGKASIRHTDGTESVEPLRTAPKAEDTPKADEDPIEPKQDTHYLARPIPESRMSEVVIPLETPRFLTKAAPPKASRPEATSASASQILSDAESMRGIRYHYGSTGRGGAYDCSAFTGSVFAKNGIILPRTAAEQLGRGTRIDRDHLQPGDLVFFSSRIARVGHVGIYYGNGTFIHCSSSKNGVTISRLDEQYYASHYVGATRVLANGQKLSGPVPVPDAPGSTDED